jgi:hypothetical protein
MPQVSFRLPRVPVKEQQFWVGSDGKQVGHITLRDGLYRFALLGGSQTGLENSNIFDLAEAITEMIDGWEKAGTTFPPGYEDRILHVFLCPFCEGSGKGDAELDLMCNECEGEGFVEYEPQGFLGHKPTPFTGTLAECRTWVKLTFIGL